MRSNQIFTLLKTARGLAVSFLKSRSPEDLPAALRELSAELHKASVAASVVDFGDLPPESVTFPISELRAKAALVQGDICTNREDLFVAKSITPGEFSAYVAAELAKGVELQAIAALDIGYSLVKRIDKALAPFADFATVPADSETFTFWKEDATEAGEAKKAAAEALAKGEKAPEPGPWTPAPVAKAEGEAAPTPTPPADVDAELAKARSTVEKARSEVRYHGGWGMDMATPRFMDGAKPSVDFGPDAKR